jgi:hypothetical protein
MAAAQRGDLAVGLEVQVGDRHDGVRAAPLQVADLPLGDLQEGAVRAGVRARRVQKVSVKTPIFIPPAEMTVSRASRGVALSVTVRLPASQGKRDPRTALRNMAGSRSSNSWLPGTTSIGARACTKFSASIICSPAKSLLSSEGAMKSPAWKTITGCSRRGGCAPPAS